MKTFRFFTKGDARTASSRERGYGIAEELIRLGYAAEVYPPELHMAGLSAVSWRDIVILQKTFFSPLFLVRLIALRMRARCKIIFDFDDAVYLHSPFRFRLLCYMADVVVAGNEALALRARVHAAKVSIVPTSVAFARYARHARAFRGQNTLFCLGWLGDFRAHEQNIRLLIPVFNILIEQKKNFIFRLIGGNRSSAAREMLHSVPGLQFEITDMMPWDDPDAVPSAIQRFDIGLMPLLDTPWNRGKCFFKALEYMACGVVPLCSPVGGIVDFIHDGKNGFLRDSSAAWASVIAHLMGNPELLSVIGSAAQDSVQQAYTREICASLFLAAIELV